MAEIGSARVIVDPQQMKNQATMVRELVSKTKAQFDQIESIMNRTANYWIGEAAEKHRNIYNKQKEDVAEMIKRLNEHPDDLEKIAGNYELAENHNVTQAQVLPADAIS